MPRKKSGRPLGRPYGAISDPLRLYKDAIAIVLTAVFSKRQKKSLIFSLATIICNPDTKTDLTNASASFRVEGRIDGEALKNRLLEQSKYLRKRLTSTRKNTPSYQLKPEDEAWLEASAVVLLAAFIEGHKHAMATLLTGLIEKNWPEDILRRVAIVIAAAHSGDLEYFSDHPAVALERISRGMPAVKQLLA